MNTVHRILSSIGSHLVDFTGLFLGYPELECHPRRTVGEALLYLGLLGTLITIMVIAL